MKAITTKYLGPTNTKGSRIKATDNDGNSVTIGIDSAQSIRKEHDRAALALIEKMDWTTTSDVMYQSSLGSGYVYVIACDYNKVIIPRK